MLTLRRSVVQFCSAPLVHFHSALDTRLALLHFRLLEHDAEINRKWHQVRMSLNG